MGVAVKRSPPRRGEVYLVHLDPIQGSEIRKTRPCLVVTPNELNRSLRTVIVAPMTTAGHAYPWRVPCHFQNRSGFVALDQLRAVDTNRLVKKAGRLAPSAFNAVLLSLQDMFAE